MYALCCTCCTCTAIACSTTTMHSSSIGCCCCLYSYFRIQAHDWLDPQLIEYSAVDQYSHHSEHSKAGRRRGVAQQPSPATILPSVQHKHHGGLRQQPSRSHRVLISVEREREEFDLIAPRTYPWRWIKDYLWIRGLRINRFSGLLCCGCFIWRDHDSCFQW